jgi:hypothetical protein
VHSKGFLLVFFTLIIRTFHVEYNGVTKSGVPFAGGTQMKTFRGTNIVIKESEFAEFYLQFHELYNCGLSIKLLILISIFSV